MEVRTQEPELLLALVNKGTTYHDSRIVQSLGFALHEVARVSLPHRFEAANRLTRALWAMQAFILDVEMGLWSGLKRKMEISESHRHIPFTVSFVQDPCRDICLIIEA